MSIDLFSDFQVSGIMQKPAEKPLKVGLIYNYNSVVGKFQLIMNVIVKLYLYSYLYLLIETVRAASLS